MPRSHLPVQYLIQQLVSQASSSRKDYRPPEISRLIEELSDLYEPLEGVARVGFDCRMTEGCWEISLYLGRTELVGGPRDGCHDPVDFCLNLQGLTQLLKEIRGMEWTVAHPQGETGPDTRTLLKVETDWEGHAVRLLFAGSPPQEVGPALRKFADGTCELL
ncbi:MAG: hypothetical protein U0903_15220 [Planctomycetales bacterium]